MGLKDRDYYQERHKTRTAKENSDLFKQSGNRPIAFKINATPFKYAFSVLLLFGLFMLADVALYNIAARKAPEIIPGGIILRADLQGHFRGAVFINNVLMPFMIDTGATGVTIPAAMAQAIGLPFGASFQVKTAGGIVSENKTHLDSLRIGTAEIRNLDADINHYYDEVLIGMSALKYFRITKDAHTLTLVALTKPEQMAAIEQGLTAPAQIVQIPGYQASTLSPEVPSYQGATKWKKTVICEGSQCRTLYDKAR